MHINRCFFFFNFLQTLERVNVLKAAVLSCSERDSHSSSQGQLDANGVSSSASQSESREDYRHFVNAVGSLFELIYMAIHQDLERRILAIGDVSVQSSNDLGENGSTNASLLANASVAADANSVSGSNVARRHSSGRASILRDQQQNRTSILEKSAAEVDFAIDFESAFKSRCVSAGEFRKRL